MSDVRSQPSETTIASDPYSRLPDARPVEPAREPASNSELWSAARMYQRSDSWSAENHRLREGYAPIIQALGLGEDQNPAYFSDNNDGRTRVPLRQRSALRGDRAAWDRDTDRPGQEELIATEIRRRRQRDPNFLQGVPDSVAALRELFLEQERQRRAQAAEVLSRRPEGWLPWMSSLGGGMLEAQLDPPNLVATFLPTGIGRTILGTVVREATLGAAIELAQQPVVAMRRAELGEDFTAGEAAQNVGMSALGSAILGPLVEYGGRGVIYGSGRGYDLTVQGMFNVLPEPLQRRWADRMTVELGESLSVPLVDVLNRMPNRDLAALVRDLGGPHLSPDELAAVNIIEREEEIADASPFARETAADTAHTENMVEALRRLLNETPPAGSSVVARGTTTVPRVPANIEAPDFERQWSAIIGNEGGTDRQGRFLTSPAGAIGPAQVMPGTAPYAARLAGLPFDNARYRTDSAYNIALGRAYYRQMLAEFGGDPNKAAAAYNAGPGSARTGRGVRGAMARAERAGEPNNWEAYLPRETQQYLVNFRRRTGAAPGETPPPVAIARDDEGIAAAEAEAMALARSLSDEPVAAAEDLPRQPDFEPADVTPLLRRDLFDSDEQWARAQETVFRQNNDVAEGPVAREEDAGEIFYHGTNQQFDQFELRRAMRRIDGEPTEVDAQAFFFSTNRDSAAMFARDRSRIDTELRGLGPGEPRVAAYRLKTDQPLDLVIGPDSMGDILSEFPNWRNTNAPNPMVAQEVEARTGYQLDDWTDVQVMLDDPDAVAALRADGFDSVRLREDDGSESVAVFDPEQIMPVRLAESDLAAEAQTLDRFSEPSGEGPTIQTESIEHDLRLEPANDDLPPFRLTEDGDERPIAEILEELDAEAAAAEALRGCL